MKSQSHAQECDGSYSPLPGKARLSRAQSFTRSLRQHNGAACADPSDGVEGKKDQDPGWVSLVQALLEVQAVGGGCLKPRMERCISLFADLYLYDSICLSVGLSVGRSVCRSVCLSVWFVCMYAHVHLPRGEVQLPWTSPAFQINLGLW